jgi:hypothetical protein
MVSSSIHFSAKWHNSFWLDYIHITLKFLLAYVNYTWNFIVTFPRVYHVPWLGLSLPTVILPHPPSPLLKMISTASIALYSHKCIKSISHSCPPSLFLYPPTPTSTYPYQDLFYLHVLLKCIFIVQRLKCHFNQMLTPPLTSFWQVFLGKSYIFLPS